MTIDELKRMLMAYPNEFEVDALGSGDSVRVRKKGLNVESDDIVGVYSLSSVTRDWVKEDIESYFDSKKSG